jgi:hypothetical protein
MAKINFYVKSKEKGQPGTVYLRYSEKRNIDFWIPTPEKVFPEHWSGRTGTFKQNILYTTVFTEKKKVEIEGRFKELKQYINEERLNLKGETTKDWLKNIIAKYYNRATGNEDLNEYIERFINEITNSKRLNKGKKYTHLTIKNYLGFQAQLNEYQGVYTEKRIRELNKNNKQLRPIRKLNFDDITIDFYNDFLGFFNEKNYSPNTIGRHIKHLKVIMKQALEENIHDNTEFLRKKFEVLTMPVDNVYLNEDELKSIFKLDLTESKHLEIARDVFLCGCYTAQRYSDYSRICKEHIKSYSGNKVIELLQEKTGEKCIIPIRPELESILMRYDYNLPRTHEQKVNKYIKEVCKMAEITEFIYYEEYKGGLKLKQKVPKHDLIKTHTARRSGCTNMFLAGIPTINIMKISGHKTEREFLKYIKVSKEETAINLASHPYFIGNTLSIAK